MDFVVRDRDHVRFAQVGVPVYVRIGLSFFLLVCQSRPSNCYCMAPRFISLIIGAQWTLQSNLHCITTARKDIH